MSGTNNIIVNKLIGIAIPSYLVSKPVFSEDFMKQRVNVY